MSECGVYMGGEGDVLVRCAVVAGAAGDRMGLTPRLVIGAVYRQLGEPMKVGGASGQSGWGDWVGRVGKVRVVSGWSRQTGVDWVCLLSICRLVNDF